MATTFDHSKEFFIESLGLNKQDVHEINIKLAKYVMIVVKLFTAIYSISANGLRYTKVGN